MFDSITDSRPSGVERGDSQHQLCTSHAMHRHRNIRVVRCYNQLDKVGERRQRVVVEDKFVRPTRNERMFGQLDARRAHGMQALAEASVLDGIRQGNQVVQGRIRRGVSHAGHPSSASVWLTAATRATGSSAPR